MTETTVTTAPATKTTRKPRTPKAAAPATAPATKTKPTRRTRAAKTPAPTPEPVKVEQTPKATKADAKRLLATHVVLAIASLTAQIADTNLADASEDTAEFRAILGSFTPDEIRTIASTWVHHLPADRERWVAAGLPKPDRSDWR